MQNQEIVKMIDNLKGRKGYEEKRASKLGFASLYEYFEDKISKKQKAIEDEQKELEAVKAEDQPKASRESVESQPGFSPGSAGIGRGSAGIGCSSLPR